MSFAPWIGVPAARMAGGPPEQAACDAANGWRQKLAEWRPGPADVAQLHNAIAPRVLTPGSTAGEPLHVLSPLEQSSPLWKTDIEFARDPHPANPPTRRPIVSLMKQARAFGVGVLLATQNPMDLDYRALSNAGMWFVGRLQTDADRKRVVEAMVCSAKLAQGAEAGAAAVANHDVVATRSDDAGDLRRLLAGRAGGT